MRRDIRDGSYVVTEDRLGGYYQVLRVERVMDSTFAYVQNGKIRRRGQSCIVFVGNARDADICAEQLTSGYARYKQALQQVREQWDARKQTIIASCESLTPAK